MWFYSTYVKKTAKITWEIHTAKLEDHKSIEQHKQMHMLYIKMKLKYGEESLDKSLVGKLSGTE